MQGKERPYNTWRYIFPPRTEMRVPFSDRMVVPMWKKFPDSVAQFKMNGNRNMVVVTPSREVQFWNRHQEKQSYVIPDWMRTEILSIAPSGEWTILDSELMHFRNAFVKNTLYFFDVLVWKSKHLIGWTYAERYKLLQDWLGMKWMPLEAAKASNGMFIAQNIPVENWDASYSAVTNVGFCEGLVLKRLGAVSALVDGPKPVNNQAFMCRCRKPTKNSQN